MPTYQYQCDGCKLIFEEFHSMTETVEKCQKCAAPVQRLLSTPLNLKKNNNFGKKKPGNVVKQYIKDTKEQIRQDKERILSEDFERK